MRKTISVNDPLRYDGITVQFFYILSFFLFFWYSFSVLRSALLLVQYHKKKRDDGITIYQTDWSFSALQILEDDEGPLNLAMAPLKINGDKKLFETLPVDFESPNVKGMCISQ